MGCGGSNVAKNAAQKAAIASQDLSMTKSMAWSELVAQFPNGGELTAAAAGRNNESEIQTADGTVVAKALQDGGKTCSVAFTDLASGAAIGLIAVSNLEAIRSISNFVKREPMKWGVWSAKPCFEGQPPAKAPNGATMYKCCNDIAAAKTGVFEYKD